MPMSHVHAKINFSYGLDSWNRCLIVHKHLQIRALAFFVIYMFCTGTCLFNLSCFPSHILMFLSIILSSLICISHCLRLCLQSRIIYLSLAVFALFFSLFLCLSVIISIFFCLFSISATSFAFLSWAINGGWQQMPKSRSLPLTPPPYGSKSAYIYSRIFTADMPC